MAAATGAGTGAGTAATNGSDGAGGGGNIGDISITENLDEILRRITDTKNIAGVVVVNSEGVTVKSTLDNSLTALVSDWALCLVYRMTHQAVPKLYSGPI